MADNAKPAFAGTCGDSCPDWHDDFYTPNAAPSLEALVGGLDFPDEPGERKSEVWQQEAIRGRTAAKECGASRVCGLCRRRPWPSQENRRPGAVRWAVAGGTRRR